MNKQGGKVLSTILFGLSFLMLVGAGVVYLLKEDQFSKQWADQTKALTTQNEKLRTEWQEAINTVKRLCENNNLIADELTRQKAELEKIEFAIKTSKLNGSIEVKATQPILVQFEPLKVRHFKGKPVAPKKTEETNLSTDKQVIKKIKQQMKALQQ